MGVSVGWLHTSPRSSVSTSASAEPLSPGMKDFPKEPPDTPVVCRSPVILVVAPELGVKGVHTENAIRRERL